MSGISKPILVVGERIHQPDMADYRVGNWEVCFRQFPVRSVLSTPAFVFGPTAARLYRIVPKARAHACNLLPPDNRPGSWDLELARILAAELVAWVCRPESGVKLVVALGARVESALLSATGACVTGREGKHFVLARPDWQVPGLRIPHPSGANYEWRRPGTEVECKVAVHALAAREGVAYAYEP